MAIGVGLAVLGVVVALFAVRATGRRVGALRRAVRRLAGTTLPSWRWTERDDLAGLTNELGAITTRLRERLDGLTEERDRAGQILDALDDGVLLLDGAGRLLVANPAARSWFGLPDDLRPGLPAPRVLGAPPGRGPGSPLTCGLGSRPSGCWARPGSASWPSRPPGPGRPSPAP